MWVPGRVAERLMATGCKPVAPWSYGGSNPPLSTRFDVRRFSIALALFVFLGLVAWFTLPDVKVRDITLALLAMFAVKTWLHHRRQQIEEDAERDRKLQRVKLGKSV